MTWGCLHEKEDDLGHSYVPLSTAATCRNTPPLMRKSFSTSLRICIETFVSKACSTAGIHNRSQVILVIFDTLDIFDILDIFDTLAYLASAALNDLCKDKVDVLQHGQAVVKAPQIVAGQDVFVDLNTILL